MFSMHCELTFDGVTAVIIYTEMQLFYSGDYEMKKFFWQQCC